MVRDTARCLLSDTSRCAGGVSIRVLSGEQDGKPELLK
jgi:hypothetical protein